MSAPWVVGAFLLLALRRPEAITRPQFWAEAGPVFYVPTYFHDPLTLLITPYGGYLHVVPRLVAYLERLVEPALAPIVGAVVSYAVVVSIAAFIASSRLSKVLPHAWARIMLGGLLLVSPSAYEILGVEVNLQVYLAAYLVALALATPARTGIGRGVDAVGGIAAGLSGPFSLFLAPLFWLRRDRFTAIVTVCAVVQLGVIIVAPQRPIELPSVGTIIDVTLMRVNAAVLGSTLGSLAPPATGLALLLAALIIALRAPYRRAWLAFGYGALVVAGGGILSDGSALAVHARWGERFFLLASLAAGLLVVCGLLSTDRRTTILSMALGILLVVGISLDMRVPAFPASNWERMSSCIGAVEPCIVPMEPLAFTFIWPGKDGEYQVPLTRPTDPGP